MKVALLSGASSIHTIRWANGLAEAGLEVHVISQQPQLEPMDARVQVHILPFRGVLGYFTMVPAVKKLLKRIKPDIVNAHYASGYGTTARLVGYHPWVLSAWGSDVYDFPYTSPLHKYLVNKNLLAADHIASTSNCMAEQTRSIAPKLSDNDIAITPFGVDTEFYDSLTTSLANRDANAAITIGTVKSLAPQYGIDTLIKAFKILLQNLLQIHPEIEKSLRLRLVGDGPQESELKALAKQLGISKRVDFIGRVDSSLVPVELDKLDVYVALSRQESFGVAIIEAGAAGRPVVVSNAGGLPEVVLDGQTGIVVPKEDSQAAADAISKLVLDRDLRVQMGGSGKQHVIDTYDWSSCVTTMTNLYQKIINQYKSQ